MKMPINNAFLQCKECVQFLHPEKMKNKRKHKMEFVKLKCLKVSGKLRVRIVSPGYNHDANCQFPTAIRKEGQEYLVPIEDVSFCERANRKFFYRIGKKNIKIIPTQNVENAENVNIDKVYGDDDEDKECCVCLTQEKDIVFAPCGHFTCCDSCGSNLNPKVCPICRAQIKQIVKRDQIE